MALTGSARKKWHAALLDAFPNKSALAQMVGFELSENLEAIAAGGNLSAVVFNLITWAESRSRENELLKGALAQNPDNLRLKELTGQGQLSDFAVTAREVFISYAWGGESETIANQLDQSFQAQGINIIRDKKDAGYKANIRDFMQQIGQSKCVLVVISEKYLKSENCMFELVEIANNGDFYDRIFPIVLSDARISDAIDRLDYLDYWDDKKKALQERMRNSTDFAKRGSINDALDQYSDIRNNIDQLAGTLKNMNTLTPDMHRDSNFDVVIEAVKAKLAE